MPTRIGDDSARRAGACRVAASTASALVAAICLLVLIGWASRSTLLLRVIPSSPAMAPNTAIGLLLASVSLWLLADRRGRAVLASRALASASALLGMLSLWEYATEVDLGIDQLLFRDPAVAVGTSHSGRMAVATAVCFVLLGVALLTSTLRRAGMASELLTLVPGLLALFYLTGYSFGVRGADWAGRSQGMAVHTALAFGLLSGGVLLVRPERGFAGLVSSDTAGGLVVRRVLPVVLAAPIALGWLRLAGEGAGLYGRDVGRALYAVSNAVVLVAVLLGTAGALARAEKKRRLAEDALREAEEQYRLLFENNPQPMWVFDLETLRFLAANEEACRHYGYSREEFLGMTIRDIRTPEDVPVLLGRMEAGLEASHDAGVWRHRKKDGTVIEVEIHSHPLEFDGRRARLVLANDVTQRRLAERRIQERTTYLNALVEHSPLAIVVLDATHRVQIANPAFVRLFGYSAGELQGRNPDELIAPEEIALKSEVSALTRDSLAGKPVHASTKRRRKDGSLADVEIYGVPLRDEDRLIGVYAIYEDVTERRRLEEQLRQSQKMEAVGQLAGGVAHDFNNLLTAILGYADLVATRVGERSALIEPIQEIQRAGERAASLTRQLLAFSRRQVLEPKILDLNRLVEDLDKMLQRVIGEDIRLVTVLAAGAGRVRADAGQIEQVILNLAVNARDAMPGGGSLTIETRRVELDESFAREHVTVRPGPHVMLAVTDTGSGMDSETRSHVFEPFFTTKGPGKGTGLGLATVYGIVKQSGGSIWVYSELGRGTTFKIYLPRIEEPGEDTAARRVERATRGTETVLLVEDEGSVRALARTILEESGYTVLESADPRQALETAERQRGSIHLLLTDVVMPKMNGSELASRVTSLCPGIKVLFMSGYTDDAVLRHGVLKPGVTFLQKPFSPGALTRKVRDVLDGAAIRHGDSAPWATR